MWTVLLRGYLIVGKQDKSVTFLIAAHHLFSERASIELIINQVIYRSTIGVVIMGRLCEIKPCEPQRRSCTNVSELLVSQFFLGEQIFSSMLRQIRRMPICQLLNFRG